MRGKLFFLGTEPEEQVNFLTEALLELIFKSWIDDCWASQKWLGWGPRHRFGGAQTVDSCMFAKSKVGAGKDGVDARLRCYGVSGRKSHE